MSGDAFLHHELSKLLLKEIQVEEGRYSVNAILQGRAASVVEALTVTRIASEKNHTLALLFDELKLAGVIGLSTVFQAFCSNYLGGLKPKADALEAIIGRLSIIIETPDTGPELLSKAKAVMLDITRAAFERGRMLKSSEEVNFLMEIAFRPGGYGFARPRSDYQAIFGLGSEAEEI